jgi:hypothetical protein
VKLPLLLSHYLREHKLLRLPGLGSLHYSGPQTNIDGEPTLNQSDVRFEQVQVKEADEALIDYIKQHTGKIKPLATADLESYIESGLQLLNIGRPFYMDGIGSLQKTNGSVEFIARELTVNRKEEISTQKTSGKTSNKNDQDKKRSVFDDEKYNTSSASPLQKIVVAALIVGGLAIVVLGGYYLYNQNKGEAVLQEIKPGPQTDSLNILHDSIPKPAADTSNNTNTASYASSNAGSFKFILETTNSKKRALKRYNQLKYSNLKLETVDSTAFKLYFVIPATVRDTTRIKDSLNRYYASKVKIEL